MPESAGGLASDERTIQNGAMPKILMTFDLKDADAEVRELGYEALLRVGLSRLSSQKKLRLPFSSVLGSTPPSLGETAAEIRDALAALLHEATGSGVERLVVAIVTDWACTGERDQDIFLQELVTRFTAAYEKLEE